MAVHVILVAVATIVYMTVPVMVHVMGAVMGPAGVAALVIGTRLYRPAHPWPWWVPAAGLLVDPGDREI